MGALGPAAMALQMVSSVVGGVQENAAYRRVAKAETENARLSELGGALDATAALRQNRLDMGSDLAAMASGGGALGGSITDMLIAQSTEGQMQAFNARYQGGVEAAAARSRASDAKKAGKAALISGFLGAAASAVSGASSMRDQARLNQQRAKGRAVGLDGGGNSTRKGGIPVPRTPAPVSAPMVPYNPVGENRLRYRGY